MPADGRLVFAIVVGGEAVGAVAATNPASCAVATAAGFAAEGIEREKLRYGDHRFDVETHARLATDPRPGGARLPLAV